jgi:hypothetical protein
MVTWVVLAVPGFLVVQANNTRSDRFVDCLTEWANETSGRSSLLGKASAERDEAVSRVLRDAARGDRDALIRDLVEYVRVDDARRALLADHPVPEPPNLRCRR